MNDENFKRIKKNIESLHELNFGKQGIIRYDDYNNNWSYNSTTLENSNIKYTPKDYCRLCDDMEIREKAAQRECKLCNVSHGIHSFDLLEAFGIDTEELRDWNDIPVIFLMENPSLDYNNYIYLKNDDEHKGKRVPKNWYWIHNKAENNIIGEIENGETFFKQKMYTEMITSIIYRNKLANSYLTNIVKCGLSDTKYTETEKNNITEDIFLNISDYNEQCVKMCINQIFKEEFERITRGFDRAIVFSFGKRTSDKSWQFFKDNDFDIQVYLAPLPHPANYSLNDCFRKVILSNLPEMVIEDAVKQNDSSEWLMKKD